MISGRECYTYLFKEAFKHERESVAMAMYDRKIYTDKCKIYIIKELELYWGVYCT